MQNVKVDHAEALEGPSHLATFLQPWFVGT